MTYRAPFAATPEQNEVLSWIHEFAEKEMRPAASEWDEREEVPWPLIERAHELGIYSPDFFAQISSDSSGILLPAVLEEMAWGDPGICMAIFGTTLALSALVANGTGEQIQEWMPQLFERDGRVSVAAFCSTEAGAGSDVAAMRTRAVRDGSDWVLNGSKMFITNGGLDGVHVVVASVEPDLGARGHAVFLVPPGTAGLQMGQKLRKHGIRASHTAEVVLDDVRLSPALLLGGVERLEERLARGRERAAGKIIPSLGNGAMATFEASRPSVGALAVGIARAATEFATEYATEREQFGKPIAANQGVAFTLAEMAVRTDAARMLVHNASAMVRNGIPFKRAEGSASKYFASEAAVFCTQQAMQILGGYGYMREYPVERWARDAKVWTVWEGTSQIQLSVIARALTGVRNY